MYFFCVNNKNVYDLEGWIYLFAFIIIFVILITFVLLSPLKIRVYGQMEDWNIDSKIELTLYGFRVYLFEPGKRKNGNEKKRYSIFRNRKKFYKCLEKYNINNLELRATIGLDDAAITCISTGAVYSVFSSVFLTLRNFINIDNVIFDVVPDFSKLCLSFRFLCIIEVKVVNIIIDVFRIWIDYIYVKHFGEHKTVKGRV